MVVVGFVQSISISKRFAYKHSYEIDSSQELVGLGMANLIGGMFQAFPVTGAMGQSAVNDDIGAETGVASIVTGFFVMIVLVLLTSVFEKMPLSVLAAIVITFVSGMFVSLVSKEAKFQLIGAPLTHVDTQDFKEAVYLYKVHKFDFAVWMAAFLGTLFLGVEYGLVIAVAVSLLIVIYESAYPHTAVLGRLPGTSLYRNIKQYPLAERYEGLVIVRIDAPLYFANAQNVRDKIRKYKRVAADDLALRNAGEVRYIILDLSPVSHIDTTGLHVLEDMYLTQEKLGVQLCLCNPGISVMERLLKSGMVDLVGRDHFFSDVINAVQWCLNEMDCAGSQSEEGLYESVSYPPAKGEEVRVDESKSED
jgi:sulfate transporter 4